MLCDTDGGQMRLLEGLAGAYMHLHVPTCTMHHAVWITGVVLLLEMIITAIIIGPPLEKRYRSEDASCRSGIQQSRCF